MHEQALAENESVGTRPGSSEAIGTHQTEEERIGASLADYYQWEDDDVFGKARAFSTYLASMRARQHDLYRRTLVSGSGHRVHIRDPFTGQVREMIMMASNNYLGLTSHPRVVEAAVRAIREYGAGAGSVPLLAGTLAIHRELEERLAAFKGCEDAMIFAAGYAGNLGALAGLLRPGDLVVNDILNHASIVDGCRMSGATSKVFPHLDLRALERILQRAQGQFRGKMVVVDGVFSMDGDIAPLPELIAICRRHGARLMIDEAHATGVIGAHGRGTPEYWGVEGQVDVVFGTLSKALGGVGGFVASTREVIDYLRIFARPYMFSTALPPAVAASVLAALDVIETEPEWRERLWDNIRYLTSHLRSLGFNLGNAQTAIVPLIIGDDYKVNEMARRLHERGIFVNPVFYPAVSRKLSRVRLSLMATHTREDLDLTLDACEKVGRELGII